MAKQTKTASDETVPQAGEMQFDSGQPGQSEQPQPLNAADIIHAMDCVLNSQCTLTNGCRGRLRATNAISGQVQVYCPKCQRFAVGTRPINGLVNTSGGKLFDRVAGK